jgi:hypothetical protein
MMYGGGTSISGAIDYGVTLFPQSPFKSERRVIDVSGDGSNNRGRPVTQARNEAVAADITINGLPILAFEPYLDQYFKDYVKFRDLRRGDPDEADHRDRRPAAATGHASRRLRARPRRCNTQVTLTSIPAPACLALAARAHCAAGGRSS